jgi:hypothetical protein
MSRENREGAKCNYVEKQRGMETPDITDNIRRPNAMTILGGITKYQICKIRKDQTPNRELVKHGQDARENCYSTEARVSITSQSAEKSVSCTSREKSGRDVRNRCHSWHWAPPSLRKSWGPCPAQDQEASMASGTKRMTRRRMAGGWRTPSVWTARETPLALGKKASLADEGRPGDGVRTVLHESPQES